MTQVAIISDIHGNAIALRATLAEIDRRGVDQIVCLGDVAATGPLPQESVAMLRERGIPCVMGNADDEILNPADPPQEDDFMRKVLEISAWGGSQLGEAERVFLAASPPERRLDERYSLLCVHGSTRSFNEPMHSETAGAELDAMLAGQDAEIIACGHTHLQMLRRHRDKLLLNPGAIGLTYDPAPPSDNICNARWAEYAIIEAAGGRLNIELHRAPYDIDELHAAALASGMPHADWWVGLWAS